MKKSLQEVLTASWNAERRVLSSFTLDLGIVIVRCQTISLKEDPWD